MLVAIATPFREKAIEPQRRKERRGRKEGKELNHEGAKNTEEQKEG
jgi:hypothetical protein